MHLLVYELERPWPDSSRCENETQEEKLEQVGVEYVILFRFSRLQTSQLNCPWTLAWSLPLSLIDEFHSILFISFICEEWEFVFLNLHLIPCGKIRISGMCISHLWP